MKTSLFENRLWKLLCSLKLAIVLASAATLVVMAGSLVIPGNPQVFSAMDKATFGAWLAEVAVNAPALTWWLPVAALLLFLLWLNTLCCFVDWVAAFGRRWRKSGEYLIHLGFVLILFAYLWGSMAGFRSEGTRVMVGQTVPLALPGMYLRLEAFEPVYSRSGRPVDMINSLVLLEGDRVVARARAAPTAPSPSTTIPAPTWLWPERSPWAAVSVWPCSPFTANAPGGTGPISPEGPGALFNQARQIFVDTAERIK